MFKFEASVVLARPIEEVFTFFCDAENDLHWRTGIVELKRVSGGPGEVGARYRQRVNPMGRTVDADIEITEVVPNQRISFKTISDVPVKPTGTYSFVAESPTSTRLTLSMEVTVVGFAMQLAQPMIRAGMSKGFATNFERLKAYMEGRGTT